MAGTGVAGFSGDLGPAVLGQIQIPVAVVSAPDGSYLIADQANNRIRRVSPSGTITTVAGSGTGAGFSGDGGPATSAKLDAPSGVAQLADGTILIADINNNRVRSVAPNGTISTVVGDGSATFSGDGGPASSARVAFPYDIAPLPGGGYLIVDQDNNRIRKVDSGGTISTVAGSGAIGSGGDGGLATLAQLNDPSGVIVMPDGGFLIADTSNSRIRRVAPNGIISTFAGSSAGFSGDGGPATSAKLNGPIHLALLPDGGVAIADWHNNRVRKVDAGGTITTIAGDGTAGSNGDGLPAGAAQINGPFGVGVASDGDVLVADTFGHRIRRVDLAGAATPPTAAITVSGGPACVGKPVSVDASQSKPGSGGPIVSYDFKYSDAVGGKAGATKNPIPKLDADTAEKSFNWNRTLAGLKSAASSPGGGSTQVNIPGWARDPVGVEVTVKDASGAEATAQQTVNFAQPTSASSRKPCGDAAQVSDDKVIGAVIGGMSLYATAIQTPIKCGYTIKVGCSGALIAAVPNEKVALQISANVKQTDKAKEKVSELQIKQNEAEQADAKVDEQIKAQKEHIQNLKDNLKKLLEQWSSMSQSAVNAYRREALSVAAKKKPKKATMLGFGTFSLVPGESATAQIPLGKAGRRIVKRHGVLVIRRFTVAVGVSGKQTVKAKTVVLKVKKKKK